MNDNKISFTFPDKDKGLDIVPFSLPDFKYEEVINSKINQIIDILRSNELILRSNELKLVQIQNNLDILSDRCDSQDNEQDIEQDIDKCSAMGTYGECDNPVDLNIGEICCSKNIHDKCKFPYDDIISTYYNVGCSLHPKSKHKRCADCDKC